MCVSVCVCVLFCLPRYFVRYQVLQDMISFSLFYCLGFFAYDKGQIKILSENYVQYHILRYLKVKKKTHVNTGYNENNVDKKSLIHLPEDYFKKNGKRRNQRTVILQWLG